MSGIVGTVITIEDLYEKKDSTIFYGGGVEKKELFNLIKERKYIIPLFQRELRWQKGNLLTLISDVEKKPKFLGNIILTKKDSDVFEILDGQQRTTIIYLLIKYIEYKYSSRFNVITLCDLEIESFKGFSNLFNMCFDAEKEELEKIKGTDAYKQYDKYEGLWRELDNCAIFKNPADAEQFLKNLKNCEVNVIVSTDSEESGIERFLDVNLKGVKLDTEDIFKGYLCAQDNSKEIHDYWSKLKKLDTKLNFERQLYPFMIFIEHYMRCKLISNNAYKDIEFNTEFKLLKEQTVEGKTYSQDTHLIAVIHNKEFIKKCLKEMEKILALIASIKEAVGISDMYASYINDYNERSKNSKKKIDNIERDVMFNLTKKIILDKDKAPNCLLIKYFIDVFLNEESVKQDFQKIYAVSTVALLFSLFESKKDLEIIKVMIKHEDWYRESCTYISKQLESQATSTKTVKVIYSNKRDNADNAQKFRCKTLATVVDYYEFKEGKIVPKSKRLSDLDKFLNDEDKYSLEHFIVNNSGKIEFETSSGTKIQYEYPADIAKYKNSLLNYIFISKSLNGALKNAPVSQKVNRLSEGDLREVFSGEDSTFSKMIVNKVRENIHMPDLSDVQNQEDAKTRLDEYFRDTFEDEWLNYTKSVFDEIGGIV
ncbi:DUF262 domain-containing protein [Mogibacterium sp.]